MTDLESPKKNNDCYFYYYSTCTKGDSCTFRHEPSALGCETMCSFWKEGKCLNVHCNFRHMELRKNRKAIACYWESQPGGCKKPHCSFMHQNPISIDDNAIDQSELKDKFNAVDMKKTASDTAMDSLVVNFEEESDNESTSYYSPMKSTTKNVKVKTLEEIKLEKIQAESAAYYSYQQEKMDTKKEDAEEDLRQRLLQKMKAKTSIKEKTLISKRLADHQFEIDQPKLKRQKTHNETKLISEIKIKTLEEIRAEKKRISEEIYSSLMRSNNQENEAVVSSTSTDDVGRCTTTSSNEMKRRKIKLRRPVDSEENVVSSETKDVPEDKIELKSSTDLLNKSILDENLLLVEDDESSNLTIKAEDDLLKEIDYLLND